MAFIFHTVRTKGTFIAPHHHPCQELVYYYSGEGETTIDGKSYRFSSGDFALIRANVVHDETHLADGQVFFFGFSCNAGLSPLPQGVFHDEALSRLGPLVDAMREEFRLKMPYYHDKLQLLIGEIVIELARRFGTVRPNDHAASRITLAKRYMDEHFVQQVNLTQLAELTGYSYDRFRHLFKETVGVPPLQYVFAKRLELAARLLRDSDQSLAEIADRTGFAGNAPFSSLFRREFGISPSAYRRRMHTETRTPGH
jgi:AraC-like DNA-binding protein